MSILSPPHGAPEPRHTKILCALGTAIKFFRDPANRPAAVKIIVETRGSSAEIAEQTLKLFFEPERNVLPRQAEININGLAQVIAFMGDAGTVKNPYQRLSAS